MIEKPGTVLIPTISLFEVYKRVLIEKDRNDALEAVAIMKEGRVIDLDDNLALVAAELSYEFKLPLADSIILATAHINDATLWTQDAHFKGLEGVKYIEKTGETG